MGCYLLWVMPLWEIDLLFGTWRSSHSRIRNRRLGTRDGRSCLAETWEKQPQCRKLKQESFVRSLQFSVNELTWFETHHWGQWVWVDLFSLIELLKWRLAMATMMMIAVSYFNLQCGKRVLTCCELCLRERFICCVEHGGAHKMLKFCLLKMRTPTWGLMPGSAPWTNPKRGGDRVANIFMSFSESPWYCNFFSKICCCASYYVVSICGFQSHNVHIVPDYLKVHNCLNIN